MYSDVHVTFSRLWQPSLMVGQTLWRRSATVGKQKKDNENMTSLSFPVCSGRTFLFAFSKSHSNKFTRSLSIFSIRSSLFSLFLFHYLFLSSKFLFSEYSLWFLSITYFFLYSIISLIPWGFLFFSIVVFFLLFMFFHKSAFIEIHFFFFYFSFIIFILELSMSFFYTFQSTLFRL